MFSNCVAVLGSFLSFGTWLNIYENINNCYMTACWKKFGKKFPGTMGLGFNIDVISLLSV